MGYNMEEIKGIAQQIAKLVEERVGQEEQTVAGIELGFREALRQIGAEALGLFLSEPQKTPGHEITCQCGGTLYYQRMRSAVIRTVFGKVEYKRAYYAGCSCGAGLAPLDTKYALRAGTISAGLAQLMALTGIAFSFEESAKWLKEFLLFDVSENSIRSETQKLGLLQQKCEAQAIQASHNEKALQDRLRQEKQVPQRLYGSIDAAKVRIEPRARKGHPVPAHEDWRDMKVGCWYQLVSGGSRIGFTTILPATPEN